MSLDMLQNRVHDAIADAKKTMGEVTDLKRQSDRNMEKAEGPTPMEREQLLAAARFEMTHFLNSDNFRRMIDCLEMDFDSFVQHELEHLDAGTKEGRQQLLSMAAVEMRECGDSSHFRQMLEKAGASIQEFKHYQETGDMYKQPDLDLDTQKDGNYTPSFGSRSWDAQIKISELGRDIKAGRTVAIEHDLRDLDEIGKKMAREELKRMERLKKEEIERQEKEQKRKEEQARKKKEEEEARRKRELEQAKKKEEEARRKEEQARKEKEEKERRRKEEEARKKREEEARKKREAEESRKKAEEARRKEAEERKKGEQQEALRKKQTK